VASPCSGVTVVFVSFSLVNGTVVEIDPPETPSIIVGPPGSASAIVMAPPVPTVAQGVIPTVTNVMVMPVVGPPGPRGPAGVSTNASCVWPVPVPVFLVQVIHDLGFYTAGVIAIDTQGYEVEYSAVSYPSIDITEVTFDVPFSGTIYLS